MFLGIDFGTSGCKITLVEGDGKIADWGFAEYPTSHPKSGWAEQNPDDWRAAMNGILREMSARGSFKKGRLAAISLDGSTHNAVLLDKNLKVLRPVIMWTDQRSAAESAELEKAHGREIFETAYQTPAPTWTLPQMLWLKKNEPEILPRVAHMLFVKDYMRFILTGEMCTDHIEAQGTLFYDMKAERWSESLCAMAGIPAAALPELVRPSAVVGRVTREAALETGLPEGVPVVAGASDSAVEDYAAGAVEPGQCVIKLATAGNFNVMTDRPVPHPKTLTYSHVVPGMWYTVTATNSAAVCMRWFRDNFCGDLKTRAESESENAYRLIEREAARSPIGANGVFFHPYLQGERCPYWDPDLRGSFTGVAMSTKREDFARALMEGVAFSLLDCKRIVDEMGLPVTQIRFIGGGAKSPLWSRIVCDVFGRELACPEECDASFGAALLAGVGAGHFADERDAVRKCVRLKDSLRPDMESHARYQELFKIYRSAHDQMKDVYKNLRKIQ